MELLVSVPGAAWEGAQLGPLLKLAVAGGHLKHTQLLLCVGGTSLQGWKVSHLLEAVKAAAAAGTEGVERMYSEMQEPDGRWVQLLQELLLVVSGVEWGPNQLQQPLLLAAARGHGAAVQLMLKVAAAAIGTVAQTGETGAARAAKTGGRQHQQHQQQQQQNQQHQTRQHHQQWSGKQLAYAAAAAGKNKHWEVFQELIAVPEVAWIPAELSRVLEVAVLGGSEQVEAVLELVPKGGCMGTHLAGAAAIAAEKKKWSRLKLLLDAGGGSCSRDLSRWMAADLVGVLRWVAHAGALKLQEHVLGLVAAGGWTAAQLTRALESAITGKQYQHAKQLLLGVPGVVWTAKEMTTALYEVVCRVGSMVTAEWVGLVKEFVGMPGAGWTAAGLSRALAVAYQNKQRELIQQMLLLPGVQWQSEQLLQPLVAAVKLGSLGEARVLLEKGVGGGKEWSKKQLGEVLVVLAEGGVKENGERWIGEMMDFARTVLAAAGARTVSAAAPGTSAEIVVGGLAAGVIDGPAAAAPAAAAATEDEPMSEAPMGEPGTAAAVLAVAEQRPADALKPVPPTDLPLGAIEGAQEVCPSIALLPANHPWKAKDLQAALTAAATSGLWDLAALLLSIEGLDWSGGKTSRALAAALPENYYKQPYRKFVVPLRVELVRQLLQAGSPGWTAEQLKGPVVGAAKALRWDLVQALAAVEVEGSGVGRGTR